MCTDWSVDHATNPKEETAATLASEYYGWDVVQEVSTFNTGLSCTPQQVRPLRGTFTRAFVLLDTILL
jgi:hypothetical protein